MDRTIEIKVNGSYLFKDGNVAGVQHEANAKVLRIEFDEGWDGYAKTVTFWDALGGNPVKRLLTADLLDDMVSSTRVYILPIPGEAMTEDGEMKFIIDGWNGPMFVGNRPCLTASFQIEGTDGYTLCLADYMLPDEHGELEGKQLLMDGETYTIMAAGYKGDSEHTILTLDQMFTHPEEGTKLFQPGGKRQRTEECFLRVKEGEMDLEAGEPMDPTPTQAEQLQGQIDTLLDDMTEQAVIATTKAGEAANSAEAAEGYAEAAKESAQKAGTPPYVGENGNWYVWNLETGQFVDSDVSATGPAFKYEDFTQEQLEGLKGDFEQNCMDYLAEELAKRGQLKPEFANSIEECTDTTKLYVLPDGNIYAYMSTIQYPYTNQIPLSIDTDGTVYNVKGWKAGYRFDSVGREVELVGSGITGFIPVKQGDILYLKDIAYQPAVESDAWIILYTSDFSGFHAVKSGYLDDNSYLLDDYTVDENGNLTSITVKDKYNNGIAYIRISAVGLNGTSVITVNEEITDEDAVVTYAWKNTGHAFVPADYEDRIIALEETDENHEERIKTLELYGADSVSTEEIPAYIKAEADDVMKRLMAAQGNRCFTMIGISDFHYGGIGDNKDNLIRACKAISYIQGRIHVDAVATLGDNIPHGESTESTLASGNRWLKEINEILKITEGEGIATFRTPGNHDRMGGNDANGNPTTPIPDNAMYRYIGGYNRGCVVDVPGGWGYQDFESYKLRVIVLNTSEVEGRGRFSEYSGFHMSTKQYNWLINTLDLSGKADAADWQILILSHHRADDDAEPVMGGYILPNILHAYQTGGSFSATRDEDGATISCDFAGKNGARLIGNIHGHHHAYIYGNVYLGQQNNSDQTAIVAISTPTSGFGTGAGHNDDNDGNWYDSVKDTAEETAFCVYSIDLDNHVIQAIHYGNGIDRTIEYVKNNADESAVLGEATLGTMVLGNGG